MELTAEQKTALEEQKKQCPFCKIITGEYPSKKVYENKQLIAVLDIRPATKGHVLVIPKEHYPLVTMMPPEEYKAFFSSVADIADALKQAMLVNDVVHFIAMGGGAGQQVPHFSVHLIPFDGKPEQFKLAGKERDDIQEIVQQVEGRLNATLKKMLSALGYVEVSKETQPSKPFSLKEVIEVIEQNPQLKEVLLKNPEEFKKLVKSHEQLKILFEQVSIDEVIAHYKKPDLDDIAKVFK